ncbi:6-bladed beta-propeller [Candidatus Palauibacter sp.]|uniref:6-bladed beta-propeller n=1 Tax=Candidatus Palauibacter sp. TaxID=3101350 RepID=UPI003D0EECA2
MRRIPCRTRHLARLVLLTLPLAAIGCGGDAGPGDAGRPAAGLDSPDIRLAPDVEEMYTVGVLDGAPWEMFGSVRAVAFDETGALFILDNDAGHIVVVDPAGEFVRTISNKGEGPGELNQPIGMAVFSDGSIGVNDLTRGIQFFSRDGEFLRAAAFNMTDGAPGNPIYALPDGTILSAELIGGSLSRLLGGDDAESEGRPIRRYRFDGTHDVFHAAWPGPPGEETEMQAGSVRMVISGAEPFPLPLAIGVLRDGRVVVADSVGYRIKILDASGRVTSTLERPLAPVAVTEAIREAERERRLAADQPGGGGGSTVVMMRNLSGAIGSLRGGGGAPSGPDPDLIRRMMEDQVRNLAFPDEIPVIANLAVDWSDRIWVQRSAVPGEIGSTDILTADGQYFGTIAPDGLRIPAAFGPDGLLAYIEADELDIQRVRVVRLVEYQSLETAGTR